LAENEPTNFELFADRVQSLLERWRKFAAEHPEMTPQQVIKSCLHDINDGFTTQLMKE
jgi:hypothetical protein